jgi:DNA-binding NtrC family response regulator
MTVSGPQAPKSILIAEDDDGLRFSLETLLRREGFVVAAAAGAEEAVQRLAQAPFDLVLTDLRMPDADGIALLQRVRQLQPTVQVVLMTCYGDMDTYLEAMEEGAFEYVNKPIDKADLLALIHRALGLPAPAADRAPTDPAKHPSA